MDAEPVAPAGPPVCFRSIPAVMIFDPIGRANRKEESSVHFSLPARKRSSLASSIDTSYQLLQFRLQPLREIDDTSFRCSYITKQSQWARTLSAMVSVAFVPPAHHRAARAWSMWRVPPANAPAAVSTLQASRRIERAISLAEPFFSAARLHAFATAQQQSRRYALTQHPRRRH